LARQLSTLDHLSDGRAGWNVVTSSDAFTGENFRRGGFLAYEDRYERAGEFIRVARDLWDSWADDEVVADQAGARFVRHGPPGASGGGCPATAGGGRRPPARPSPTGAAPPGGRAPGGAPPSPPGGATGGGAASGPPSPPPAFSAATPASPTARPSTRTSSR